MESLMIEDITSLVHIAIQYDTAKLCLSYQSTVNRVRTIVILIELTSAHGKFDI